VYVCLDVSFGELVSEVHWADAVQHAGQGVGSAVVDVLYNSMKGRGWGNKQRIIRVLVIEG
jgi:hypothetical protein